MIIRGAVVLDLSRLADRAGWLDPSIVRRRAARTLTALPAGVAVQVLLGDTPPMPTFTADELLEQLKAADPDVVVSVLGNRADAVTALLDRANARGLAVAT